MERRLYQFPLSLYCEKSRWNLEHKRLSYTPVNLMPGPHILTAFRLGRIRTLPVLADKSRRIGDSTRIALYLDQHYPEHPLLSAESDKRGAILALEDYFDDVGDHIRRCVWNEAVHSEQVNEIFFRHYDEKMQRVGAFAKPLLRQMIKRTFNVAPAAVEASWQAAFTAFLHLEAMLHNDPQRYLVGEHFTLADLTAATMLAPLLGPEQSPWPDRHLPVTGISRRSELRATVAGQWVLRIYAQHRKSS